MLIPWQFGDINIVLAVDKQAAEGHIMRRESATASFPSLSPCTYSPLFFSFFFFSFKVNPWASMKRTLKWLEHAHRLV